MNQGINRKAIILGLILGMGIVLTGFGIRKAVLKDQETCSTKGCDIEPASQSEFHILEAISNMVVINR